MRFHYPLSIGELIPGYWRLKACLVGRDLSSSLGMYSSWFLMVDDRTQKYPLLFLVFYFSRDIRKMSIPGDAVKNSQQTPYVLRNKT